MSTTQPRKRRGEGALRRAEILAAAKRLFLEEGYEHATMRRVAAAVGVSSTALYLYFPDKDAILLAIAEDFFAELLARLEAVVADAPSPLEALERGLRAYVAFGRERPEEYRVTFLAKIMAPSAPGRPAGAKPEIEAADRSFAIMQTGIAALIEAGIFRPVGTTLLAESFLAAIHGLTALLIDQCHDMDTAPEALTDGVIGTMIRGAMVAPP
jgi:AcrR family transcriptional regulator